MDGNKSPAEDESSSRSRSPVMGVSGLVTQRRENTTGILRLDIGKPRRSSGGSVEFKGPPELLGSSEPIILVEPPSPQPSVDRLSVTFAPEDSSGRVNFFAPGSPPVSVMEKVHFSRDPTVTDVEDDDEEDYSASVCAILQRRTNSRRQSKRRSRRPSSPFSPDVDSGHSGIRRRSSCFTTSSGDTAISIDDGVTQEQIYENLRLHKEVLSSVKQQPWGMRRKLKLVQQAKAYVKRHEGELQERLAQSKTTRDILASCNIILIKKWQYLKRELANLVNLLIPWELRIKEIESHFGSVVSSYFTFLRWLFWVNLVITVLLIAFVAIPEMLTADPKKSSERKMMLPEEKAKATNLITLWDFEGILKYSPIFYGYYTNRDGASNGYRLPFAYFMTGLAVYIYSFVATLKRMAENSRMSKLSEKDDECVFTWKLLTGWDYMIGNAETAHNRAASIILGFKEALLEEAEKKRNLRNWKIIGLRVLVNFAVLALLAASAYAVVVVVQRSTEKARDTNWWRQNEITVVLTMITFIYPSIFEVLGFFEGFHPRKQLRIQLARIMVLNMLNLYTLIFALFGKISLMTKNLQSLKPNTTEAVSSPDFSESVTLWPRSTTVSLAGTDMLSNLTPPQVDVTTSIAMLVTAIAGIHNVTNFMKNLTDEDSTAVNLVITTLTSIINSDSGELDVPKIATVLNETEFPIYEPAENSTDNFTETNSTYMDSFFFSESTREFVDNNNSIYNIDKGDVTNISLLPGAYFNLSPPLSEEEDDADLYDINDDGFNHFNTENGNYIDKINIVSTSAYEAHLQTTVANLSFEVKGIELNDVLQNSSAVLITSENMSDTSIAYANLDSSTSLENDISLVNNVSEAETISSLNFSKSLNLSFDDENEVTTSDSTTENKLLTSDLFATLSTLIEQNKNLLNTTVKTEHILKLLHSITTNMPLKSEYITKCSSLECNKNLDNRSRGISFTTSPVSEEQFSTFRMNSALAEGKNYNCNIVPVTQSEIYSAKMDMNKQMELRRLCWETMFGQELVKLTVMDLVVTVSFTLFFDFIRAVFVRVMNNCWCWDLEKQFPKYGDFKIAENILHLVNNQGMVWMGMFFSPGLPLLNLIKLAILMYLRSWAVLTCNVPHEIVFRASRSNNFYFALLLTMLFLCVLPVGYAIVWVEPSWHCGPFSGYKHIYHIFTKSLQKALPNSLHRALDYIASPGTVIPLLLLLVLVIYYLLSLTSALREANNDLKIQLRRERTEERRKMFQLVHRRRRGGSGADGSDTAYSRWRKILPVMPSKPLPGVSAKETTNTASDKDNTTVGNGNIKNDVNRNELLTKFMKRALRKSSATSDEESVPIMDGDGTDIEMHDSSLPEDKRKVKAMKVKPRFESHNNRSLIKTTFDIENEGMRKTVAEHKGDKVYHHHHHHHNHRRRSSERRHNSPSTSSTNREREDSVTSAWSDNIPVIRISKTDSFECIQQKAEPQQPSKSGSSDTVIAADAIEPVHKPTNTASSYENASRFKKTEDDFVADQSAQDSASVDPDKHKRLVQSLLAESKQRLNREEDQGPGDTIEMTCRNREKEQDLRKDK